MNSIFHRVSIRKYTDEPVTDEQIEQLLRAGMAAPSACNQQPWCFYVVTDPEIIAKLAHSTHFSSPCRTAPLVIVPCIRSDCRLPHFGQIDLSAATENILLEADALGLGACWMGVAPHQVAINAVRDILSMPDTASPFCLISCGHPAESRPQQDRYDPARVTWVRGK